MSRAKVKRSGARGARKGRNTPAVWTIVVVDQEPLRRKTAEECQRQMRRLDKARADWSRFEREDKPAFERWMAVTFGPLMTEMREISDQIREKENLIDEVETELLVGDWPSYEAAYRAVRRRKEQPPPAPRKSSAPEEDGATNDDRRRDDESEDEEGSGFNEFEEEQLFDEFLRVIMGMNPDRMSDAKYQKMFADFRRNVLGHDRNDSGHARSDAPQANEPKPAAPTSRLKELYRILVRRLHPDTRADSDAQVSAIWHEVQEAYSHGNVERLEMLLAFTDMQAESTGTHTTLAQMRAVLTELRRSLNALLRTLSSAKREMAWNFAQNADRARLEEKLRRQMARDVEARKAQLQELDAFIASWSASKRQRRGGRRNPRGHAEFPF
jgi:hypothetical protein